VADIKPTTELVSIAPLKLKRYVKGFSMLHTAVIDDIAVHRTALLRFARRKVRDEALAEDAVQDTLIAALQGIDKFQGQSAFKTWLIGILNHKIQDIFRREGRYVGMTSDWDDDDFNPEDNLVDDHAEDPAAEVARGRMLAQLDHEIDRLPPTLRDVFVLQALEDMPTEEVCEKLQISEANCWVRLHRARKRLSDRVGAHL
jgi:RNA polymerase sigma-70 factor, ECF subfamily